MNSIVTRPTPPIRRRRRRNCAVRDPGHRRQDERRDRRPGVRSGARTLPALEPRRRFSVNAREPLLAIRACRASPGSTPTRVGRASSSARSSPRRSRAWRAGRRPGPWTRSSRPSGALRARGPRREPPDRRRPSTSASAAPWARAVKIHRLARDAPISLGRRCVPPAPGRIASAVSRRPMVASSARIRRSQARASSHPPPTAAPRTAAIVGNGSSASAANVLDSRGTNARISSEDIARRSFRSAPPQKCRPPVRTTRQRASRSSRQRRHGPGQIVHELPAERVHGRPVDRHRADAVVGPVDRHRAEVLHRRSPPGYVAGTRPAVAGS